MSMCFFDYQVRCQVKDWFLVERILISYWKSSDDDVDDAVDERKVWLEDLSRRVGYVVFDDWFSEKLSGRCLCILDVLKEYRKILDDYFMYAWTVRFEDDMIDLQWSFATVLLDTDTVLMMDCHTVGQDGDFSGMSIDENQGDIVPHTELSEKDGKKMIDVKVHLRSRSSSVVEKGIFFFPCPIIWNIQILIKERDYGGRQWRRKVKEKVISENGNINKDEDFQVVTYDKGYEKVFDIGIEYR